MTTMHANCYVCCQYFAFPFNISIQKPISFLEPSPKMPYLKKHISLRDPQIQEKEVKVQILVSSQEKVVNEVTQFEIQ